MFAFLFIWGDRNNQYIIIYSDQPHRIFHKIPLQVNKINATPTLIGHPISPKNYAPNILKYDRRGDTVFKLIDSHRNNFRHI